MYIVAEVVLAGIALHILEIVKRESYTATTIAAIVFINFFHNLVAYAIVDELRDKCCDIYAHTLVKHAVGDILIVDQNILNRMHITVESLNVGALYHHALIEHRMHGVGTSCANLIGQGVVLHPTVDVEGLATLTRTPYLHHGVGQHGLVIIVGFALVTIIVIVPRVSIVLLAVILKHKLVGSHLHAEYMVCDEHIESIIAVRIVVTSTYLNTLLVKIVIPCRGTAILRVSVLYQIVKRIDAF